MSSREQDRQSQWQGLLTHFDSLPLRSASSHELGSLLTSRRYEYLTSWASCCKGRGWKLATGGWLMSLVWAQIFRVRGSEVVWADDDIPWNEIEPE